MRCAVCAKSRLCDLLRMVWMSAGYNKRLFHSVFKPCFAMNQAKIAHYQLQSRLGQGAMGVVFRARDERLEREVALKLLQVSLDSAEATDYAARLLQEARSAARLNHPGIITVFDCGEWRGKPYLAMELVQGISLKQVLDKHGTLSIRDLIRIAKQMFSALAHAHQHDVVHRDIKPANLMLTKDGRVKITDFGIAQLPASDLTRTGTILGSPRYMSPEQLAGSKLDGRADIYSAGVVLYQALTGRLPFDGETTMNIVFHILHSQPVDPRELDSAVPSWLAEVILRCLAKKREDRFASADEVLQTIQSAGAEPLPQQKASHATMADPAVEPSPVADEVQPKDTPIYSWLQQTGVTLLWLLQESGLILQKIARRLWPWLRRIAALIQQWAPIVMAQLLLGWQKLRPILVAWLLQAKRWFLAQPRKVQVSIVGLGAAGLLYLMWPNPESEIAAATITWSDPHQSERVVPQSAQPMATPVVETEPAPTQESDVEHQPQPPAHSETQSKPKRSETGLNSGLQHFGKAIDSAVTGLVDCIHGKTTCPTPTPEQPRRGGG
ncbi:protein kinase [Deefgea chitinilytica]|uniref:Protein kinase n=2 Tax=Chitinibacteraceae TaxID=2897177 RepID=A0ABS2CF28_9NEIS|nr:protein kinase [Deefgea chitinilytica]